MQNNTKQPNYFNIVNDFEFKNTIIEASLKAKKAIESGAQNVYNATIGSLFDEDGKFFIFNSVFDLYNNKVSNQSKSSYCPNVDGGNEFSCITKKWLFKNNSFLNNNSFVCATPGGSSALSSVIRKVLDNNSVILIPDYTWEPIELMSHQANIKIVNFKMFDKNNKFFLDDLFSKIDKLKNEYKKIALYLNDPIHNPTSYSMTNVQWTQIINKLNHNLDNEFVIINDVAYIEFSLDANNSYMNCFKDIKDNTLLAFCISYSKSLTFYGLRLGALIIYHNNINISRNIYDLLVIYARASWSNSNHGAIQTIIELDKEQNFYFSEKTKMIETLKKRFEVFIKSSNDCSLPLLETSIGFFITIPLSTLVVDKYVNLLNKKNVFVVPLNNGIRIGICSLNINQCKELPIILKDTLLEVKENER